MQPSDTTQTSLPAWLPLDEVATHAGVKPPVYKRWLKRQGACERIGNDPMVDADKLREIAPRVYERVLVARATQVASG